MAADLYGTRNAYLGCHDRVFADFHVVGNLYQIVQFDTPADDGRVHNGAVYRGIGPDFDIVFQYDITQLGDLLVVIAFWSETETVRPDHASGMQNAVVADYAAVVDGRVRIDRTVIANGHMVADISVRINAAVLADLHVFADVGEVADITSFADRCRTGDERRSVYTCFFDIGLFRHIQQYGERSISIGNLDQCGFYRFGGSEIIVY